MIESRTIEHFFDKDWFPAKDGDIENNRHAKSKMLQLMSVNIIITLNIK